MKKKYSFLVISFFRVTNPYSGASEVSYNFFKSIPAGSKKLIQLSDIYQNIKQVKTIKTKSYIDKFLKISKIIKFVLNYCKKNKNPVIIIEGASWVGYSFLLYVLLKNRLDKAKFIYHSHNIEYLLRKDKNNFLISSITKFCEKFIAKKFDIFTCVSKFDKRKLKEIYSIDSNELLNGINIPEVNKVKEKKLKYKYIFFCGNIDYLPNMEALEILVNKILPAINKKKSNIKLIVSGNRTIPFKNKNLINIGFVSKNQFYSYLKGASLFVNPMKTAFGSQVKMITALVFGKTIIATNKAIFGLDIDGKKNNLFITNNHKQFVNLILKNINANKINKTSSKFYQKKYSIKNITLNFLSKI